MFEAPEDAATAGVLSLLLEVSGNPKSGNVDRTHDFPDMRFEHFLASSSAVYPVFLECAEGKLSIGRGILKAVERSKRWQKAGNVHFGCFMLLIPLIRCWSERPKKVVEALKRTDFRDSLAVLKAFKMSGARVMDVEDLSLKDEETERLLVEGKVNLYEWLKHSPKENVVAMELIEGYPRSYEGMKVLMRSFSEHGDVNTAVVHAYHYLLSKHLDPLVIAKHGMDVAESVRSKAEEVLRDFESGFDLEVLRKFDEELLRREINPGSIADLTASSIFLALKEGWRF